MKTKARNVKGKDYSMHLIPVDSENKSILGAFEIHGSSHNVPEGTMLGIHVPAITMDGRISFLPIGDKDDFIRTQLGFRKRIEERYPKESYSNICTYVCAAVVLVASDRESKGFIFEVWGFTESMTELEQIYQLLVDVAANMDKDRTEIEEFLSSKPVKSWVNALIEFLKQQLNWTEYVDQAYCQLTGEAEKSH